MSASAPPAPKRAKRELVDRIAGWCDIDVQDADSNTHSVTVMTAASTVPVMPRLSWRRRQQRQRR